VKRGAEAKERTRRLERERAERDLEPRIARRLMVVDGLPNFFEGGRKSLVTSSAIERKVPDLFRDVKLELKLGLIESRDRDCVYRGRN